MITDKDFINVFEGNGFLSNYESNRQYFSTRACGHIAKVNPLKLLEKVNKSRQFYDRLLLSKLIDSGINITLNKDIVFSDWHSKEIKSIQELKELLNNDQSFNYIKYAVNNG